MFEEEKKDAISIIQLLYSNRKTFIYVIVASLLLSVLVTFLMPNKYHSFGIIFAPNSYNRNNLIDNPQFGFELDADNLMQILESESIRNNVIKKFDLINYYEIDTTDLDWEQQVARMFVKDITFFRSKYMSIVIAATTKSPQLSANIVNYIIEIVNSYRTKVYQSNMQKELSYKKYEYEKQKNKVDSLRQKVYELKGAEKSKELLYNHLLMASKNMAPIETYKFIDSEELENLIIDYKFAFTRFEELKADYYRAQYFYDRPFPENYVVDKAKPQYKKESPSFITNCAIGVLVSVLFSIVFLFVRSKWRSLAQQIQA